MFGWWRGRPRLHGRRAFFWDAGRTTCRVGGALDRLRPASSRASLIWLRPRRRERRAGGISGACGNRADRIRPRRRANSRPRHRQALRISPIRITGVTSVFAVARAMPVRIRECVRRREFRSRAQRRVRCGTIGVSASAPRSSQAGRGSRPSKSTPAISTASVRPTLSGGRMSSCMPMPRSYRAPVQPKAGNSRRCARPPFQNGTETACEGFERGGRQRYPHFCTAVAKSSCAGCGIALSHHHASRTSLMTEAPDFRDRRCFSSDWLLSFSSRNALDGL